MTSSRPVRPTERELSVEAVWREQNPDKDYREWLVSHKTPEDRSWESARLGAWQKFTDYEARVRAWEEANPGLALAYKYSWELHRTRALETSCCETIVELETQLKDAQNRLPLLRSALVAYRSEIDSALQTYTGSPRYEMLVNPPPEWVDEWERS